MATGEIRGLVHPIPPCQFIDLVCSFLELASGTTTLNRSPALYRVIHRARTYHISLWISSRSLLAFTATLTGRLGAGATSIYRSTSHSRTSRTRNGLLRNASEHIACGTGTFGCDNTSWRERNNRILAARSAKHVWEFTFAIPTKLQVDESSPSPSFFPTFKLSWLEEGRTCLSLLIHSKLYKRLT